MSPAWIGLILIPTVIAVFAGWAQKNPNTVEAVPPPAFSTASAERSSADGPSSEASADEVPPRLRWPKFILICPLVLAGISCFGLFTAFTSIFEGEAFDAILSLIFLVAPWAALAWVLWRSYENWYVELWPEGVRYRRATGGEGEFRYCDIQKFTLWKMRNGWNYHIWDVQGRKLGMNATMYDASRLVAQLAHRAQYGFWATPEQLRMALESGVLEAPEVDLADLA
ncbi:hypothetical protein [Rothia kristinae]|uniref:hypothetical protein n=1 Tax=Rothia kristinae TaxID=37923 RepID=UPI0018C92F22|nr:hypothetical protein [Rothia kristinae]